jgi:lipopolysaccharide/colanic/teichoic acid biosynthesis glycosyltransferase/uncharacterized tellurite resistance protein B-like protein
MTTSPEPPYRSEDLGSPSDEAPLSVAPVSSALPRAYRLTGLKPSSVPPPSERDLLLAVADVLLAAAQADGEVCRREERTLRKILGRLLGARELPIWLEEHLRGFDPNQFDLREATERLRVLPPEQRRHVIELVREVCDANNAYDLEEERYLLGLVLALALGREDIADLVVHSAAGIDGLGKRLFDLLVSSAFLANAWPLLVAIGLGVKLTSPGPAIFKQQRYGRDGQEIEVWKFRTMTVSENGERVRQAKRDDPRVTRFGAFLRSTSLDELPQFINVFFGQMSVVGPRPHAVAHNLHYRTQILEYMLRHKVKPGITGLAQVNGWRGETDTLDKMVQRVLLDLEYIRRYSLWLDVEIVFRTIFGRGARANAY